MSTVLNKGQEEASAKVVDFLKGKIDIPYFTLTGDPGTGKTFMLKEALNRANLPLSDVSGATIAHAAKNVLETSLNGIIKCFTVAQWLGLKMTYDDVGSILFQPSPKAVKRINDYKYLILDEASMIDDWMYHLIMKEVDAHNIKLITVGDVYQLPPVGQNHDSKFFEDVHATLTEPMRFMGPITSIAKTYKEAISQINDGFVGDKFALNSGTSRQNVWDNTLDSGYKFVNNIHDLVYQVAYEIKESDNINHSRMLAFKNETVSLLNTSIRDVIYGKNKRQLENDEILISNGGFAKGDKSIVYNGQILRVEDTIEIVGPYEIPCLSVKFKGFIPENNTLIPVVMTTKEALSKYGSIKAKLKAYALKDPKQWKTYYNFIESFAYFDYCYSVNTYKAQGQTLTNVYVFEGEIMNVKPLTLKQKYQALYVACTRATNSLYIYNKDY